MGSINGNGRDQDPKRRRGPQGKRKRALPDLESLEERTLLSGPGDNLPTWTPTNPGDVSDVKNGPLANAGTDLIRVYQEYQNFIQHGGRLEQFQPTNSNLRVQNGMVGVDVRIYGDVSKFTSAVQDNPIGMRVTGTNQQFHIVEGFVPISQLTALASFRQSVGGSLVQTVGIQANYKPMVQSQGAANNQAEDTFGLPAALQQFPGITGAGVTVGVLSDSANRYQGGLADSISTGDLPPLSRIQILQDEPLGGNNTDEGRAMMELIYDLAPGANLAFNTGFGGVVGFADGIRNLSRVAGAQVIVDDVTYANEPFYQVGPIEQAASDVVRQDNRLYFSSAANQADGGFESPFRATTATVGGVSGTFMDFDPGPGVLTRLPITVSANGSIIFQYDQPYFGVTSDVDILLIDANGNIVNTAGSGLGGRDNNIATQVPFEFMGVAAGSYTVAVVVNSGSAPGRIQMREWGTDVAFSQQFGGSGGISYPTTIGHNAGIDTISVGAVPYFEAPPYGNQNPLQNEDYSSFGPRVLIFDANGNRMGTQVLQRPQVSGPDGTNTTFFIPGVDQEPDGFPNFFGTSAAAPNLAAIAALMRQLSPGVNQSAVLTAMQDSTIPLNGTPKGTWDAQGGYGLVQALASFQAVDKFRVTVTSVPNNSSQSSLLKELAFRFNRPVNPATLQTSDLQFTQLPPGVSVRVTNAFVPSDQPDVVVFQLEFTKPSNLKANGVYAYTLANGSLSSTDGKPLVAFSGVFSVNDVTPPKVVSATYNDRIVKIIFSEPLDPSTITPDNILVLRTGSSGVFNNATNVTVSNLPGARMTYDANSRTITVDLSALPQTDLPSDRYAIVVEDNVRDLVGNRLDGEFATRTFPSGNGTEGGKFAWDLGYINLQPPQVVWMQMTPDTDTGIAGDSNTRNTYAWFIGQVAASFPGTKAGLKVYVQFNGLHNGTYDLTTGSNGRGISPNANFDVETTTDANGRFAFGSPRSLPDGFQSVRIVVVNQTDNPPLPGLSTQFDKTFRVDTVSPFLVAGNVQNDAKLSSLKDGVTFYAYDPPAPTDPNSPFAVPLQYQVPTLDPATATNISNYSLYLLGSDNKLGGTGTAADTDYSSYITGATFVDNTARTHTYDWYRGVVNLSFADGLPSGRYMLIARSPDLDPAFPGITDAAGNALDGNPDQAGIQNFAITFDLQPIPTYITGVTARSPVPGGSGQIAENGPQSYFEVPLPGATPRADAPPTEWYIDFSGPLGHISDPGFYDDKVMLIRSSDTPTSPSDGDFGTDPSFTSGVGYTILPHGRDTQGNPVGTTVELVNSVLGAQGPLDAGYKNRLVLKLPPGTSLTPDKYRLYIPNQVNSNGQDLRIVDLFDNQIDGEFLGNRTASGGWETLLPTGRYRQGLSGDLVPGGSFETGYVVVPNGNVIFARPDYSDDPFLTSDDPDGSFAKPFPVLAPEALPPTNSSMTQNGGDLNSSVNFQIGFNPNLDLNGNGHFDRSAFFAASQLSTNGPVVVVALPAQAGDALHRTFVLQKPSQDPTNPSKNPTIPDGSASVPYNTMLVFQPGSILKMRDASLYVQNQGSAIQFRGGPNPAQQVYVTSYNDDSVGGDTNRDGAPSSLGGSGADPFPGDFGGILLRNFDDTSNGGRPIPISPGPDDPTLNQVDGRQNLGLSGADDALSSFNFTNLRYGGGSVPRGGGVNNVYRFDAITLFNSRPMITNVNVDGYQNADGSGGPNGGSQGGISGDMDSFREDDLARGPLVRRTSVQRTSLNGIYVRAEINGVIEPTDAITYPDNPRSRGGSQNYTFDDPLPYIFVSRMVVGQKLIHDSGLDETSLTDRLYVQPGMVLKFQRGAAIDMVTRNASINVGDRTYINQFDANPNFAPTDPDFRPQQVGDARVLFTSFFDDDATTEYVDPNTGVRTTIVPRVDSDNGTSNQPSAGNVPALARWGSISVLSGSTLVFDEAEVRYGGGSVNTAGGTIGQRDVLFFYGAGGTSLFGVKSANALGTRAYVTNNNFYDNIEAPIAITPNGLLAADPLRPLSSGNPYFRGNIMLRNSINGVDVLPPGQGLNVANQTVDSVWDDTDLTYVLRGTIRLAGAEQIMPFYAGGALENELKPAVMLTIQSSLPDTLLADGTHVAKPGESVLVKLLSTMNQPVGDGASGLPGSTIASSVNGGAGFLVGIDNGVDPTADRLMDPGWMSQIRILGIGGNETTGQPRVPAIITSARDDSVGRVIRGVRLNSAVSPAFLTANGYNGVSPQAGDGGIIGIGGHSLSDYNLYDPRDGNLIDNADIRYLTRIDLQGGGWAYSDNGAVGADNGRKIGSQPTPAGFVHQYNTAKAMTISNSNLDQFSQVGVISHPSGVGQIHVLINPPANTPPIGRDTLIGQPWILNMVNNSISNMPTGVRINGDTPNNDFAPTPYVGVFLNNTFYNNPVAITTLAPNDNGVNDLSHVYFLAMDNIFANSSDVAVRVVGQATGSQLLYNLYSGTPNHTDLQGTAEVAAPFDAQPISGNAEFRDAPNGDFNLTSLSDAIDAGLSEVKQSNWGQYLTPIARQALDATGGVRNTTGRDTFAGGLINTSDPGDIVTLPGLTTALRGYADQFVPVLQTNSGAIIGPASVPGLTYGYKTVIGERDLEGYLRQDEPSKSNVGFGSRPFFDVGAYEYRELFPPHVIDVKATVNDKSTTIYIPDGTGGVNKAPQSITVKFDQRIDPATLTSSTVLLQASGGDGIFGNANNSQDRFIPLSGKLSYNALTSTLTIALTTGGLTLGNDLYRIIIRGSGDPVVRNEQGLPLDGESTVNGDPTGAQLPLPSGNGIPGGDFYATFSVDTHPPQFVSNSIRLAPQAAPDPRPDDNITSNNLPVFTGQVTDVPPPLNPLAGLTVYVDFDMNGDGTFELIDAGRATTDAQGFFSITPNNPLPDTSRLNVGPDGILGTADDTGYSRARFFVKDQSGNFSTFEAPGTVVPFVLDTKGPKVTGTDPLPGALATVSGNQVAVAVALNENVETSTVNTSSIKVVRSGGDGTFNDGNEVSVSIDPASLQFQYLKTASGAMILRFNVVGASVSDVYRVTLVGAAAGGILDIAGNPLDGDGDGTPGGDFNLDFVVYNPGTSKTIFVDANAIGNTPDGSRGNPYRTINAGIAAAGIGDTVAVIAGSASGQANVYREQVKMKSLIKLVSADPSSSAGNIVPGLALKAIIRPDAPTNGSRPISVLADNLVSVPTFQTEIRGFTIASSLSGDPVNGTIASDSLGVYSINSDLLIDRNYIIDSQIGIAVIANGNSRAAQIVNNGVIGNVLGMWINDYAGSTSGFQGNADSITVINNTVALNTDGLVLNTDTSGPIIVSAVNNIFWQNADQTVFRNGHAINSSSPNRMSVRYNLFSENGPSATSPSDDTVNVGGGFSPALLTNRPDALGNLTGTVRFVSPIDPRPTSFSGPGNFYLAANYDLTSGATGALDNALNSLAPSTDFRFRSRFDIAGYGFAGPADIGAFEFNGAGGIGPGTAGSTGTGPGGPIASGFSAQTSSSTADGGGSGGSTSSVSMLRSGPASGAGVASMSASSGSVTVAFSGHVDRGSVDATDLLLSGDGLDPSNPAHATSLSWVDDQTVRFNLDGAFRSSGTILLDIPAGAIRNTDSTIVPEFATTVDAPARTVAPAPTSTPTPTPTPTPAPAPTTTAASPVATAGPLPSYVVVTPPAQAAPVVATQPLSRREQMLAARQAAAAQRQAARASLLARFAARMGRRPGQG